MHRILACLAALALFAAVPGPAQAGLRTERRAHAFLLLPERGGVQPFVFVSGGEITAEYQDFAIGRGVCRGDSIPEDCSIQRRSVLADELRGNDVFEVDPALETAHLKITRRGVTHEMTWTAAGDARPVSTEYACGQVPSGPKSAGAVRTATASGTLFGKPVTAASAEEGFASLSLELFGC